jgi:hypothetical protein
MSKSAVVYDFLSKNTGYLKWSPEKVAIKLGINPKIVKPILKELRRREWNKYSKEEKEYSKEGVHILAGCFHFPFHNERFFENAFLKIVSDTPNLAGVHLLGDMQDLYSLSSHNKGQVNIKGLDLEKEYMLNNKAFDKIDQAVGHRSVQKTYIYGNHEDRYFRELKNIDSSKYGGALLSPKEACFLVDRGYTVKENWKDDYVTIGKYLDACHGQYTTKSPAKKHLDTYKRSLAFVHTHIIDQHYDAGMAAFNIGWGGNMYAPAFSYASRITKLNWQNGFAAVYVDEDGYYHVNQLTWYNNKLYYNNRLYK